ncbi:MAG: hypothetical protein H7223_03935 [Pedobacter sp.]|nr:hypothetical protein [Pedobacter sp.]
MEQKKKGNYKVLLWIAGILGSLILLIGISAIYLSVKWKPLVTEKLKDGVHNASQGLYALNFEDIHLNLLTGSATLDRVSLMPDTAIYNQLRSKKTAPANLYELKLEKLRINRLGILTAYFKKKLELNAIILDHPSINILHFNVPKKDDNLQEEKTLYEQISKALNSIHVKAIKVVDADLDYMNGETGKALNSVKHLDINVIDFLVDSLSQSDSSRFYYTKDINFVLKGYKSTGKDKMYTIKVDTITGSARGKSLRVLGLQMIPLHPDLEFSRMYKYGKDRYDLKFDHITFAGVDFLKLNNEGSLHSNSLSIGPAKVNIFVNRELPAPPGLDKVRNFPHVALKRFPIPIVIDTLKLRDLDVAYTEYNPLSLKKGTVFFENFGGNIYNLTNDSLQLKKNNHAVAKLHAMVMKTSRIDITMDLNLTAKNAAFTYKGSVAAMDMKVLNTVSKNMGLVEIESGKMQKTTFDIKANKYGSSGTVAFYYTNLKVKLLKDGELGEPTKKKGLLSFIANTVLIKDDNPTKNDPPRIAKVTFERTPAASFFNLLWKGVFIGMRETIGLGIVPVKTPEQAMKKVAEKKENRRAERQERRAERKNEKDKKKKADQ